MPIGGLLRGAEGVKPIWRLPVFATLFKQQRELKLHILRYLQRVGQGGGAVDEGDDELCVNLTQPAADVALDHSQASQCTAVNITINGVPLVIA